MFWNTEEPHGLPHAPFKSCVVPRPIGWISSVSPDGIVNLAPYSFFNGVSGDPPMVMFAAGGRQPSGLKDSRTNVEATGEFVCNMVTWELREPMNASSAPAAPNVDEFQLAGLETEPSELVAPIHLECRYYKTLELPADRYGGTNAIVTGRVVGIHIRDAFLKDGLIDIERVRPVARMGYQDYTSVQSVFKMLRPGA